MDSVIAQLQNGIEPRTEVLQDIRSALKYAGHSIIKSKQSNAFAPKAWKVLTLLAKTKDLSSSNIELAEICAEVVEAAEGSLKISRLDFEKLLVSVYGKAAKHPDSSRLASFIHLRLLKLLAPKSSPTVDNQIDMFPGVDTQDPEIVNVLVIYLISCLAGVGNRNHIQLELSKLMEIQYRRSPLAFFKSLNLLAQRDYAYAIVLTCTSEACIKECLKTLAGIERPKGGLEYSTQHFTVRSLIAYSYLGLEIPANAFEGHDDEALWSIANGQIPPSVNLSTLDRFFVLAVIRRFERLRPSIDRRELCILLDFIGPKCPNGDDCKLLKWCLRVMLLNTFDEEVFQRLKVVAVNHVGCAHSILFAIGVDAFKKNCFDKAVKLIQSSLLSEVPDDGCEVEAQKYDYLATAQQASGGLPDAIKAQCRAIDLTLNGEVQVLGFVPSSEQNSRIVKRTERWLRYLSHLKDDHSIDEYYLPSIFSTAYYPNIVAPLLKKMKLSTTMISMIISRFAKDCHTSIDLLKTSYTNYEQLTVEHVKLMEGVFCANGAIDDISNIWLNALKHFVGIADRKSILKLKEYDVCDDDLRIRCLLLAIYDIEELSSIPANIETSSIDPFKPDHLIYASWRFLCRSVKKAHEGIFLQAIEFALESQRLFDLLLRCLSSSQTTLNADDKLRIDAIASHLFSHLSIIYGQRPFIRETRYYVKQAMSSTVVNYNSSLHSTTLDSVEAGQPVRLEFFGYTMANTESFAFDGIDLIESFARKPLISGMANKCQQVISMMASHNEQTISLFNQVSRCCRLSDELLDRFGLLSLHLNKIDDMCRFLEYNKSVINLNFPFASKVDVEREPTASIQLASIGLLKDKSISISLLRNASHSLDILWIAFYGSSCRLLRLPLPDNRFDVWKNELESIEANNKILLKRKEGMTTNDKRLWWEQRIALDKRMSSLIVNIKQLLGTFMDWKQDVKVDNISTDGVLLNMEGLCGQYSEALVNLVFNSLQLQGVSVDRQVVVDTIRKRHVEDELDNVFMSDQSKCSSDSVCRLLLSPDLYRFPWEHILDGACIRCVPILLAVPSNQSPLEYCNQNFVSYVINPSGDLVETERRFAPLVTASTDFCGVLGRPPSEQEMLDFLTSSKLYLYCGHGGGDAYLSNSKISKLKKIAPSLLIGCSSGKIKSVGVADPEGNPIAYTKASSPFVVCNLWDVTDKDIDAFTMRLLNDLLDLEIYDIKAVANMVHGARTECNLKFINGAAPVLYQPFIMNKQG